MFDCEAVTDTETCAVDVSRMGRRTAEHVGKAIEQEMERALKRIAEHVVTVGQLTAAERVLRFVQWLEEAYSERGLPARPLPLPMNRTDIGDYLGLQQETVCRAFAKLKERGLVALPDFDQVLLDCEVRERFGWGARGDQVCHGS